MIGTHALLEEHVQFADLGLVVVDEQHRFGVEQRAALRAKAGTPPHVLVMTATPIPRTVAMTVFGDLDTSTLSELPAGRGADADDGGRDGRAAHVARPRPGSGCARRSRAAGRPTSWPRGSARAGPTTRGRRRDRRGGRSARRTPWRSWRPSSPAVQLAGLRVELLHGRLPPEEKDA